jgi:murein DD-endopeptidase MepM/ murein hydrolase activator NlpD
MNLLTGSRLRSVYKLLMFSTICFSACKSGTLNVFKPASPHEVYQRKLLNSGLVETAMGKSWIDLSDKILLSPAAVEIPYLEKGYFSAEKIQAAAFSFKMERGHKLSVKLNKRPLHDFVIYTDIWQLGDEGTLKIWGSSDTLASALEGNIDQTGTYILRLQPELLVGGEYTLEITSGPSVAYPLKTYQDNQIRSFWGDGRDANTRRHEGIDIFSTLRTPVLASVPGVVKVNENNLGGKVVWLSAEGRDFSMYYAHLDEQTVSDGQRVKPGDTLGLMGNTGNARTTAPHLHLGIYTQKGAVNPLPFVNPEIRLARAVKSDTALLKATLRTSGNLSMPVSGAGTPVTLQRGTIVKARAASAGSYRVELPDGTSGYIAANKLTKAARPLRKQKITPNQLGLFDKPDSTAAVKSQLQEGQMVDVLGSFNSYQWIRSGTETGWIRL